MKLCSVDDCGRPHKAKGLCYLHWRRQYEGRPLDAPMRVYADKCSVDGCDGKHKSLGYCGKHLWRWTSRGDVEDERANAVGVCDLPGCGKPHYARGWCQAHYLGWYQYGDPLGVIKDERTKLIRADLRMALEMRAHGRRRDVEFYIERAESHGRKLRRPEREFAEGLRMEANRERDTNQLRDDVMRMTGEGLSAKEIGRRLGVSDRTVVRYRTGNRGLENINA